MSESTRCAANGVAVTPSDSKADNFAPSCRALYIGVGGDAAVIFPGNATPVVFKNLASGTILPAQVLRVNATATTATNIVALF